MSYLLLNMPFFKMPSRTFPCLTHGGCSTLTSLCYSPAIVISMEPSWS